MINLIKNKKGSALLMTLFILTGVLAVVLTASQIVDAGIKTGRIQSDSTKAYFAAETGVEQVLWEVRKNNYTLPAADTENIFPSTPNLSNGSSYQINFTTIPPDVFFTSIGNYKSTKRSVQVSFQIPTPPVCTPDCLSKNCDDNDGCGGTCDELCTYPETCQSGVCAPTCGNSVIDAGESCDDGNGAVGDGCDAVCQIEPGWICDNNPLPSVCSTTDGFVSTWKTDNSGISASNQITLPLVSTGSYNFVVNWGDGTSDSIITWNDPKKTHTYSTPGIYTISIPHSDEVHGWSFGSASSDSYKILVISNWGNVKFEDGRYAFYNAKNLKITAMDQQHTVFQNFQYAFYGCSALTTVPDMDTWNVSAVTNMEHMFDGATSFNQNIGVWDVGNVTNMSYMFNGAVSFNQSLDWSGGDGTGHVTNMEHMFDGATSFNQNIGSWDVHVATNMEYMFNGATSFNQNLSSWHVNNVTNMTHMFDSATTFNQNLSIWNVGKVNSCSGFSNNTPAWTELKPSFIICTP